MIRLVREEDLKEVNKIRQQVFNLHVNALPHIFKVVWDEKKEFDFLQTILQDENVLLYVFESDGEIAGYAQIEKREKLDRGAKSPRRWCHLSDFGVTQKERSKGVGTEFLRLIEKELKALGFSKLELNVWEFNQGAMRFYERNGFYTLKRSMEKDI